jgi:hypothetical protein
MHKILMVAELLNDEALACDDDNPIRAEALRYAARRICVAITGVETLDQTDDARKALRDAARMICVAITGVEAID